MRGLCILLVILGCGSIAAGQLSEEEALQRLKQRQQQEREKAQAVASSRPADSSPQPHSTGGLAEGKLVHEGWTALVGHRYQDGVTALDKAIGMDAVDPVALQGRGICKYELKDYKNADKDLLKAYNLSSGGGPARVPRQLVIAYAGVSLMTDNPMRGVKALRATMESLAQNGTLDEELQNDLGICLSHANETARRLPLFEDSLKFYTDYDKKLEEQKKNGTARWGDKWIGKGDAEEKWKTYKDDAKELQQATSIYQHCVLARQHAFDNYLEIKGGLRLHSDAEIYKYTEEYKQSLKTETAAQRQMNKAAEKLGSAAKPPFPSEIQHDWTEPR